MNKRYALCVGNNYPGTDAELGGCVNDALDWADLLQSEGYEVTLMMEASKPDVMQALAYNVARSGFADRFVFTYSGHGTWVPDRDGDEADGRDEALVMSGLHYEDLVTDDELQRIFNSLHYGTGALVLSDSCHSGTVSRMVNLNAGNPQSGRKFLSPVELGAPIPLDRVLELEKKEASPPRRASSLISGCADQEYSYDASFNGRPNGAFTRAALDTYMRGISLGHWFTAIREHLPSDNYPQTPQLTTTTYRKYTRAL